MKKKLFESRWLDIHSGFKTTTLMYYSRGVACRHSVLQLTTTMLLVPLLIAMFEWWGVLCSLPLLVYGWGSVYIKLPWRGHKGEMSFSNISKHGYHFHTTGAYIIKAVHILNGRGEGVIFKVFWRR